MACRWPPNSVPRETESIAKVKIESKVTNPLVCLNCGEEIADLSKVFVGKCCKNQYLCWNCHFSTTCRSFFHCNCCGQDLFRNWFQLQDLSGVLISARPKCYSCGLQVKLEYILPGDLKICSDCFDKGMFNRSVKRADKMQFFIGLKTHNIISSMKLFPLQCAHKIVYDNWNNYQGLACVGCQELLQGNCYELECHHFACLMCGNIVYCTICQASFNRTGTAEFRGMQHPNLLNRKVAVAEENKETKKDRSLQCIAHRKICIRIKCWARLCSDCFNEMADRKVSVIYGSGAAEEHCICRCIPVRGQHIISVASLIEAESQIEYLEDIAFGQCSRCYKYTNGLMKFRGCIHKLCIECASKRLNDKHFHRQYNKLNGKSRIFLTCGVHDCTAMVPIDMLPSFIKKMMSASSNLPDSERETAENLVSHATLISSEAKDVLLKKEKDLATGSLNKENEDTSILPSSVTTKGVDKFSHLKFADEACSSGTDDDKPRVIKKPSDKDHKSMTTGKSSNSSKQSEEHKQESVTTSGLGMEFSSGPIEDKLSAPQSADNGQEKRDNEPVGTLKMTDKGNDNKGPSKVKILLPTKGRCSETSCRNSADAEFTTCGHLWCFYCLLKLCPNGEERRKTVFCGIRKWTYPFESCQTKIPTALLTSYIMNIKA